MSMNDVEKRLKWDLILWYCISRIFPPTCHKEESIDPLEQLPVMNYSKSKNYKWKVDWILLKLQACFFVCLHDLVTSKLLFPIIWWNNSWSSRTIPVRKVYCAPVNMYAIAHEHTRGAPHAMIEKLLIILWITEMFSNLVHPVIIFLLVPPTTFLLLHDVIHLHPFLYCCIFYKYNTNWHLVATREVINK